MIALGVDESSRCGGKNKYPTEGEARRAQYKVMLGHGTLDLRSRVYKCRFGEHFHHGRIKTQKETK